MSEHTEVELLLVEDNPRDAELTLRTLRKSSPANRIVHVRDGQEALDWLLGTAPLHARDARPRPKVVLLDLKLPKVDGLEVLRALRADERTCLLPVVVMTSSQEQRDVIASYQLGVNSYIVKPVDFDAFSTAVAELGHYWLLINQGAK
ncbi:MAG: response regulator [Verrucomicrobiota bacterium]